MKRKKVLSTSKKTRSVEGRSVESEGSYRKRKRTPAATPALLVSSIKFDGVTAGSMIELAVQVLPDLYLETVVVTKGAPDDETLGILSVGTLKKRGQAKAKISAELYDYVLSQAQGSKLLVTLEYADTRVTDVRFENI